MKIYAYKLNILSATQTANHFKLELDVVLLLKWGTHIFM